MDAELFAQMMDAVTKIDGKFMSQVATAESGIRFVIAADDERSLRYAAALLASGDTVVADATLTEN